MSEMSELTLTIIKLGFLAVLWLFVLTAVSVMRSDLFGRRAAQRSTNRRPATPPPAPARAERAPKAAKGKRGVPSTLVVTQGALSGTTVRLGDSPVTLGRSQDSTIVLDDDYVSSRHARFFSQDGRWYVEDLGSTNGTQVGGHRITNAVPLYVGTTVKLGKTVLEVRK